MFEGENTISRKKGTKDTKKIGKTFVPFVPFVATCC